VDARGTEIERGFMQRRWLTLLAGVSLVAAALIEPVSGDLWVQDSVGKGASFSESVLDMDLQIARWELEASKSAADERLVARLRGRSASGRLRGDFSVAGDSAARLANASSVFRRKPADSPSSLLVAYDVVRDPGSAGRSPLSVSAAGERRSFDSGAPGVEETASVNLALALFPWLESAKTSTPWSAKVEYGFQHIRQLMARGTTQSAEAEAGSKGSLSASIHTFGAHWSQQWLTVDYRLNVVADDDLDPLLGRPDAALTAQRLTAKLQPGRGFGVRAGLERGRPRQGDTNARRETLGLDWQLTPGVGLAIGCERAEAAGGGSSRHGCTLQGDLARSVELFGSGPLRLFARPSYGHRKSDGSLDVAANEWGIAAGLGFRF